MTFNTLLNSFPLERVQTTVPTISLNKIVLPVCMCVCVCVCVQTHALAEKPTH